jgi:hypothetical protein
MALFKNYLTCYCMTFILNHAECSFTALKLKKLRTRVVSNCLTHSYTVIKYLKAWKMQCFILLDVQ